MPKYRLITDEERGTAARFCEDCGSLVLDMVLHDAFHESVDPLLALPKVVTCKVCGARVGDTEAHNAFHALAEGRGPTSTCRFCEEPVVFSDGVWKHSGTEDEDCGFMARPIPAKPGSCRNCGEPIFIRNGWRHVDTQTLACNLQAEPQP